MKQPAPAPASVPTPSSPLDALWQGGVVIWVVLAAEGLANQLRDVVGPWSVILAVAIVVGVVALAVHVDYRALIEDRKFRLHRGRR